MNGIDPVRYSMIIPSSILPVIQEADDTHICKNKDSQRILRAKESRPDANCDLSALQIDTKMFPSSSQIPVQPHRW